MLARRLLIALALWTALAAAAAEPLFPALQWTRLAPAASGWSAEKLLDADAAAKTLGSDAVLVVHRGAIVHEYGDTTRPMNLYSARKSVLSALYGIHAARGEIDLQATLEQLGIGDKQGLSEREKTATVQQLLQARSGVYHGAAYETAAMAAARPPRGSHAPGTFWYYNNWDFNALGTIFRQRTGRDVFEALASDLAAPLQFEDFNPAANTHWQKEAVSDHPAYVIDLSARDLARFGLLMARDGRWGERQIVPAAWVAESTQPYSATPNRWLAYGYLWWLPQRAWPFWSRAPGQLFFGSGNFGQLVIVDRARDLVVVHRTDGPRFWRRPVDDETVAPLLERILAAMPSP